MLTFDIMEQLEDELLEIKNLWDENQRLKALVVELRDMLIKADGWRDCHCDICDHLRDEIKVLLSKIWSEK